MTRITRKKSYAAKRAHYVKRIVAAWQQAKPEHLEQGLAWYDRAQETAKMLHPNMLIGAGVIAALSPQTEWSLNVRWARQVCDAALAHSAILPWGISNTERRNKAWAIANLIDPTVEQIVTILRGPKVTRFFRNITGDHTAVTVDVWAMRVAQGFDENAETTSNGKMAVRVVRAGLEYDTLESAYQIVAERVGTSPRSVQAAVWVSARSSVSYSWQLGNHAEELPSYQRDFSFDPANL